MITISTPRVSEQGDSVYLISHVIDEKQNFNDDIWFKTSKCYGDYLCYEVADPFLLLVLMQGISTQQDIIVDAPISQCLKYNLDTALIHIFTYIYGSDRNHKIKISSAGIVSNDFSKMSSAVACGCSLGVDSLSAIKYHTSAECPEDYRLTHLTYFNIGALGEHDLKEADLTYRKNLEMVSKYAKELNLSIIQVESNSAILFHGFDFDQTHTIRNMATVLSLQKLIRRYYYGSSFPIQNFELSRKYMGSYEHIILPLLSTANTELIVADKDKSRTDKTRFIANTPLVQKNLYVCWKDIFSNGNPKYKQVMDSIPYLNCTRCDKCMRTALALDILGVINAYGKVFDLEEYFRVRQSYIYQVLSEQNNNTYYKELADLMVSENYKVPNVVKYKLFIKKLHLIWLWNLVKSVKK